MTEGDIRELRDRIENIAATGDGVLAGKAAHLLDQLVDEWGSYEGG